MYTQVTVFAHGQFVTKARWASELPLEVGMSALRTEVLSKLEPFSWTLSFDSVSE